MHSKLSVDRIAESDVGLKIIHYLRMSVITDFVYGDNNNYYVTRQMYREYMDVSSDNHKTDGGSAR